MATSYFDTPKIWNDSSIKARNINVIRQAIECIEDTQPIFIGFHLHNYNKTYAMASLDQGPYSPTLLRQFLT